MVVSARHGVALLALCALASAPACSSVPTFPSPPHDAGTQCSATQACPGAQTCLQGICYASCDMTHPCPAREMCRGGACVANTSDAGPPPRDMGTDGGPCEMLDCASPSPVCRADVAMCVQCDADNHDECGTTTGPICDVGRSQCAAAAPALCAPCNVTADCPAGLSCVLRSAPAPVERVCLPGCAAASCSDPSFSCGAGLVCTPFVSSCTAYRAAVNRQACAVDADCPQLGATIDDGLVTGMCFDDGGGRATCHAACGLSTDCPTGLICVGHFCQ